MDGIGKPAKTADMKALAFAYRDGTTAEREIILEKVLVDNQPLIKFLMRKHYPSYAKNYGEDMIQEANIAIIEHFPSFDPEKGKFSTFMGYYVLEAFKWFVCRLHDLTPHYFAQYKKYVQAKTALAKRGVREITADILAEEMGCGLDAVLTVSGIADYMNAASIEGDDQDRFLSGDNYDIDPQNACEEHERRDVLLEALGRLNDFEKQVITLTYLRGDRELSLKEVGARLGTDIASVRRARNKALRQLSADKKLSGVIGGARDYELHDAADDIVIEFTVSKEAIDGNLAIALDIDIGF